MAPDAYIDFFQTYPVLSAALWKPKQQRRFGVIGRYRANTWSLLDDVFPNEKYGFNGRRFHIVTMPVC